MLSKITIKKLFNLYDYTIDLTNADGSKIKFITAPNGYGKTTILDFIYEVMTGKYHRLYQIPFAELALIFCREDMPDMFNMVSVVKSIRVANNDQNSDEASDETIELEFSLKEMKNDSEKLIERFCLSKNADDVVSQKGDSSNINMFFVARTCHYITDSRLLNVKTDFHDETLYFHSLSIKEYADEMKRMLKDPEQKNANASKIDVFKKIIDRCDFSNKHMEVDERFGFRFVANDKLETKLLPDDLSSGEKHMIIQTYEILFRAQTESLVMIDEPELSLHMMWQINYLKNLQDMIGVRGFQCIVATHSPQVFNNLWSKSIDLFTLSTQN